MINTNEEPEDGGQGLSTASPQGLLGALHHSPRRSRPCSLCCSVLLQVTVLAPSPLTINQARKSQRKWARKRSEPPPVGQSTLIREHTGEGSLRCSIAKKKHFSGAPHAPGSPGKINPPEIFELTPTNQMLTQARTPCHQGIN